MMSGRETAELLLLMGRLVQAECYHGELSPAQWMALRFFARANQFSRNPSAFAEFQATTRGTASQAIKVLEAGGYLVRTAIRGGRAKRCSPIDGQRQRSDCARSVRSSGARRGIARRGRANRGAPRPASRADHCSGEWGTSALRCLPGLRVPRWRSLPPPNARDPVGSRMPAVRRSDRAGGRWSPLCPFFGERASTARTDTVNEFTTAIC